MRLDEVGIKLHPTTIYRILKRRNIRYYKAYEKVKNNPKLYCLEYP
jgi:transposase